MKTIAILAILILAVVCLTRAQTTSAEASTTQGVAETTEATPTTTEAGLGKKIRCWMCPMGCQAKGKCGACDDSYNCVCDGKPPCKSDGSPIPVGPAGTTAAAPTTAA